MQDRLRHLKLGIRGLKLGSPRVQGNFCNRLRLLTQQKGGVAMKIAQKFLNPVSIMIVLSWFAFFGGILIENPVVSLPLAAIARVLP